MQAAIATLYDEAIIVKNALDNAAKERDKHRADLQEAHKRAVEVANDIDEQNSQHDKEREQQIKVNNKFVLASIYKFNLRN